MGNVEEMLNKKELKNEELEAPSELEERLRNALKNNNVKIKNYSNKKLVVAAILIVILAVGYSFDAIAYYGKKILGYDRVTYGNLAELNERGRGQEIGKSYTFSDGTVVTLDGIMFDDNELVAFIRASNDNASGIYPFPCTFSLSGINPLGYSQKSGVGKYNDNRTEISYVQSFETPHFYEKWMTFQIIKRENNSSEIGNINFTLDRDRAMGYILKKDISKSIEIDGNVLDIKSINISPLTTIVEGTEKLINSMDKADFTNQNYFSYELFVNGNKYEGSGGNRSSVGNNVNFRTEFYSLPADINSLEIKNIKFVNEFLVDKTIDITKETRDLKLDIKETDIRILKVYTEGDSTLITIKSQKYDKEIESKYDPNFALFINNEQAEFQGIINSRIYRENTTDYIERTLEFKGIGENLSLRIKAIYTTIGSDEVIDVLKK